MDNIRKIKDHNNKRIVFDPDGFDGFVTTVRDLDGYLLRFEHYDGFIIKGVVDLEPGWAWTDQVRVRLWDEDSPNGEFTPPEYRVVDLNEVHEVYYY